MLLSAIQHKDINFAEKVKDRIDSLIEVFSPRVAFQRRQARTASKIMFSAYSGASKDRLRSNWLPGGGSADADLLPDLPLLRERSRDLIRNDGHASGIQTTFTTNIIGTGIKAQSRLKYKRLKISKEQAKEYQEQFEAAFDSWIPDADASEKLDFYEIQDLCLNQIIENGDVIVLPMRIKRPGKRYTYCLQVIEADRLATPPSKLADTSIREGVEIGDRGQPIAYWIKKTHPGDINLTHKTDDYIRYPAFNKYGMPNVHHLFKTKRPGQSRGIPVLAPVLNIFKDLSKFVEAELLKNRIAACFSLFVKKNDPLTVANQRKTDTNTKGQKLESIEPGRIEYLNIGESIDVANPTSPGGNYDPFVERMLRAIAAALNLPYEIVAKDFSKTNYSSARAALLDAVKFFICWQDWISKKLNQPVYTAVIEEAFLNGEIDIPLFYSYRTEWTRVKWQAPGWQWVDPLKEVQANKEGISGNILSLADVCSGLGRDWEETIEQKAVEKEKLKELGLYEDLQSKNAGKINQPAKSEKEDNNDDENNSGRSGNSKNNSDGDKKQ